MPKYNVDKIIEAVKAKMDSKGYINIMDGHQILLTVEFYQLLRKLGKEVNEPMMRDLAYKMYARDYKDEVIKGLINRHPQPIQYWQQLEPIEADMHDNYYAICATDSGRAREVIYYGLKHFFHYDFRSFRYLWKRYSFKEACYQCLQRTRQPFQVSAYALQGFGICDPISYLHLLIVILIEPFKKGTSGKNLLFLFSERAIGLGKPLAWLYRFVMHYFYDKNWLSRIYKEYYGTNFPELVYLAEVIDEEKNG